MIDYMKKFITVVLIFLIIVAMGIGGWYFYTNQQSSNNEIEKLKNELNGLKEEKNIVVTNNASNQNQSNSTANTSSSSVLKISDVIGAYDNGGGEIDYQCLCMYENGTFQYYTSGMTDVHEEGYFVINDSKVTLYAVLACANDPGATVISKKYELTISNESVTFNNIMMRKSSAAQTRYNNENGGINLGNEIGMRLKNNFLTAE